MRVVIVGAGEVGFDAAQRLSREGHEIVVVDEDEDLVWQASERLDALVVHGNGATPKMLREVGIKDTELLVATTGSDETNITACLVAKYEGVPRTVARLHNPDYHDPQEPFSQNVLGIDFVIHTEQVATEEIKSALLLPGAIDVESFAGGRIVVVEVILKEDSPAVGCAVRDVDLPERSLIIGGVRGGEALMSRGDTVLNAGDHVFLIGERERITEAINAVATEERPVRDVIIVGGGRLGLMLARALEEANIEAKVIEKDAARAEHVASQLERGQVLHEGDISREVLLREGVDRTGAFIAVTGDDRTNLLASMYAKRLGAHLTIAGVGRGEFIPLAERLGVDVTISPRLLAASAISRFVRAGNVVAVTLLESGARMTELRVPEGSKIAGRPLAEVGFPKGAVVGMVMRDGEVTVPRGSDSLKPGDDVVVFTVEATVEKVERFFEPKD